MELGPDAFESWWRVDEVLKKSHRKILILKFWKLILKKITKIFEIFFENEKMSRKSKIPFNGFKNFHWKCSIFPWHFLIFENISKIFVFFFFQNQFSKFQNQCFSMRFILNLIYFLIPFQRTRSQLPTPKTQRFVYVLEV